MNTQPNVVPEFGSESRAVTARVIPETERFFWLEKRELWENRSIYLGPLGVATLFLFGFLISAFHLPARMRELAGMDPEHYRHAVAAPYDMVAGMMMFVTVLVNLFYCIDALYGERRDRSILFWKSLPVSDTATVLSKASIPLLVVPLVTWAITVALQWIMLLVSSVVLLGSGLSVATLWTRLSFFQMSLLLLYHLFTAHTLWPAPVYCYLLLVSGWARRAVLMWAALPLVAISGLELIIFHTSHFAIMVGSRLIGLSEHGATYAPADVFPTNPMAHVTPFHFLRTPGLWIGLVIGAVFLFAAIRVRRERGPI